MIATTKKGGFVTKASGLGSSLIPIEKRTGNSLKKGSIVIFRSPLMVVFSAIYQLSSGCYSASEDENTAPVPYASSPVAHDLRLANTDATVLKIVEITVTILDPFSCFSILPYDRVRLEFLKLGESSTLKTIAPIRNKMTFEIRLKQGEKYKFSLKGLDGQTSEKVVSADGEDMKIEFRSLCRKQTPSTRKTP